jgi:creatine kinase
MLVGNNLMRRMSGNVGSLFLSLPWVACVAAVAYSTKPDKVPEFKNWMSPPSWDPPKESAKPIQPVQAAPKPAKFELKSVNGKLVVDAASAPACVEKILEIKAKFPDNCMAQAFDRAYYESLNQDQKLRLLTICLSGVANEDSSMGCYAMNPSDYDEFAPFFKKALAQYHRVDLSKNKHTNNWSLEGVEGLPADGILDLTKLGLPALSMRVRTGRNLNKYPLPGAMTKQDRINMEKDMKKVFDTLIADPAYGGRYVSITPGHECFIDAEEYAKYVKAHIMFKDMSADSYLVAAGIAQDWPYGRGCYVSEDKGFIVWVGEEDHLRIMCMKKGTVLNEVFDRLKKAVDVVQTNIEGGCAMSKDYGVVTSCPTNIGTGMRASVHIQIPNLTSDGTDTKAKAVAKHLGLSVRGVGGEHTPIGSDGTVDISPSARFCISEAEIVTALYKGIKLLKEKEDAAGKK